MAFLWVYEILRLHCVSLRMTNVRRLIANNQNKYRPLFVMLSGAVGVVETSLFFGKHQKNVSQRLSSWFIISFDFAQGDKK